MITKVRGAFDESEGTGYLDAEHPERSSLELSITAPSIDTRNADRDAHLRSNDFLAMDEYRRSPTARPVWSPSMTTTTASPVT